MAITDNWGDDEVGLQVANPALGATVDIPKFLIALRDGEDNPKKESPARLRDLNKMQQEISELNRFVADMDRIIEQVGDRLAPRTMEFISYWRNKSLDNAVDRQAQMEYKQRHS